ncbi:MAG TPA: FecR domain-containing protein [Acetobacteraceae bacterium]|nr:FecR domain-containing protein [Acetobacteraceae bacterium]
MMRGIADTDLRDDLRSDSALREALQASAAAGRLSNDEIRAMRAARRRRTVSVAAIALVAVVGFGGWRQWMIPTPTAPAVALHFGTKPGETRVVELADGSSIQLGGGSRVDVNLGPDRREVRLEAGEAYFDVAHDPSKSFTVRAGATDVRVLGTAFNLNLTQEQVGLAVYRGAVRFAGASAGKQVVTAGYRTRFHQGRIDSPVHFDPMQPDWRLGWLDTAGMTLGDLVEVLDRQGGPSIAPPPPALAGIAVSGRFRLDNSGQLLDAIGSANGFHVRREAHRLVIGP